MMDKKAQVSDNQTNNLPAARQEYVQMHPYPYKGNCHRKVTALRT